MCFSCVCCFPVFRVRCPACISALPVVVVFRANNPHQRPDVAVERFDRLLRRAPLDALYGRANALDRLAERRKDNALLEQSIEAYSKLIDQHGSELTDEQLLAYGTRCVELMRFKGACVGIDHC